MDISILMGVIYLSIGLASTGAIIGRLFIYWESFERPRKMLLIGYILVMFAWTQRGIELIWFNAPPPRPIGWLAIAGALVVLAAFLLPEDKRLEPTSWRDKMKMEDPALYDKYIDVLNRSAANREIYTTHSEQYRTDYGGEKS